jgi:uroporphyrinogen decarboxylase
MRTDIKDRFYRTYTYQDVDRVPDLEFGYWPQTIRRWLSEGLPLELTPEETNEMFLDKLDDFFGFECEGYRIEVHEVNMGMHPAFEEKIIRRRGDSVLMRDERGVIAERFLNDADASSIPHFMSFPVETPDDWVRMKERYRLHDPIRALSDQVVEEAREAQTAGKSITVFFVGFYGQLRNWMGMQNLSLAFYDHPHMIHDMVQHWAALAVCQIEQLPSDIPIDQVDWWEDMAGRNGPLVSPDLFREFLQPGYRQVMKAAKQRGCVLSMVDCDGNPYDIVANWLEEGVNIMFPMEVQAGVDPYAWREEFGRDLRLRGGIAKRPLVEGGAAIDRELERIRPLLEQGGYIPHLDHLVPPDIPYVHYCRYLEGKRNLIGK